MYIYFFHPCNCLWVLLSSLTCKSEKIKTINGIATVIIAEMWRCVKFCTFFKNLLHCEIPALTVEWQCLYGPLSTCNCYLDISHWKHFNCGCLTCNIKTTKHSHCYVTKTLLYITALFCGWVCRTFKVFYIRCHIWTNLHKQRSKTGMWPTTGII